MQLWRTYTYSNPVTRKGFTFLYVLLLFCLLNVKLFLATGFEIGTPLPKDRLDIPVAASSWVVTLETLLVINLT